MKALSIWQPWASAIIAGQKRIETRAWPVPAEFVGLRVAIHAGLNTEHVPEHHELPLGCILGSVVIRSSIEMSPSFIEAVEFLDPVEATRGWYEPGRFAFLFEDPRQLEEPVPLRGYQRFFHVDDAVVAGTIKS